MAQSDIRGTERGMHGRRIKGQAYIDHLYYELGTGGVGTFTVTISYGNMEAQATILVTPPTDHNIQDQILSLGEALRKGASCAGFCC